jgi:bacteriorhodopsin
MPYVGWVISTPVMIVSLVVSAIIFPTVIVIVETCETFHDLASN